MGVSITEATFGYPLWKLKISQVAPILPYLFLVLILIFRPKGLLGTREAEAHHMSPPELLPIQALECGALVIWSLFALVLMVAPHAVSPAVPWR
jgi:hypothetical protein